MHFFLLTMRNKLKSFKTVLTVLGNVAMVLSFLAEPGEARGRSTNSVIHHSPLPLQRRQAQTVRCNATSHNPDYVSQF